MDKPIIYFICTGNACRSQMAEGFGKVILGDNWTVMSGGIEAHGVNPHAVKAMQEVNIDISDQTSDKIDIDLLNKAKLVVTLCDHAEAHCPVVPNHVKKVHWGLKILPAKIGLFSNRSETKLVNVFCSLKIRSNNFQTYILYQLI